MLTQDMPSRLFTLDAKAFGRAVVTAARGKPEASPPTPDTETEDVRARREENLYWSAYEVAYCAAGHFAGSGLAKDIIATFTALFGPVPDGVEGSVDDVLDALAIPNDPFGGRVLIAARTRLKLTEGGDVTVEELGVVTEDTPESILERGQNGELEIRDGIVSADLALHEFLESRQLRVSIPARYDACVPGLIVGRRSRQAPRSW